MKFELYLQNSDDGTIYNITNIANNVQVSQSLDGTAGRLTCILQKDPNKLIKNINNISNGSKVAFIVDKKGFFFGYIFKVGTDLDGNYKITCYDSLRYLKNNDVYCVSDTQTATDVFIDICKNYKLKYEVKYPTSYKTGKYPFCNKSLYYIIKRGMDLASVNDSTKDETKRYFIIDNYGTLVWSEITKEKTNIQLGDSSLVTSFTYEKSIDSDTYNKVKFYRNNETTGGIDAWSVKDDNNIFKWGVLQLLKQADTELNEAQIQEKAKQYLDIKNRETETLKLQAEGIPELRCGMGIRLVISRENIDKWLWITSITHNFTKDTHTMDMEVQIN